MAQLVGVISMPLLARLYGPDDFGFYGVLVLSTQVLALAFAGRYEQAIMLAKRPEERSGLTLLALLLAVASGVLAILLAAAASEALDRLSGTQVGLGWCLVAATAMLLSWNTTLTVLAIRIGRPAAVSISRVVKAMLTVFAQAALYLLCAVCFHQWGLFLGEIVAFAASTALLAFQLRDTDTLRFVPRLARPRFRAGVLVWMRRYRSYPLVNLPHALSSAIVGILTLSYLALQFSVTDAGQYFMMFRIVMLPSSLIGTAVSQVYFKSAVEQLARQDNFWTLIVDVSALLGVIAVAIFIALAFAGVTLFTVVLGEQWRGAGVLAEIFAPYVAIHLLISALAPTSMVAKVLGKAFCVSLGQSVVFLSGLWLGDQIFGTIDGAVVVAVYSSVPYMIGMLAWYGHLARARRPVQ